MVKLTISNEEINDLPLISFQGKVTLITHEDQCAEAIRVLEAEPILGFDTETRPAFKKGESYPVCLLQLSTNTEAFLFRLNKIPLIKEVRALLEDEKIIKTGVAIHDDIKGLKKLAPYEARGFVEIADLAKKLGIKKLGLRSLAAILFDKKLSKKNKLTNWEKESLTEQQLNYAATDAWLSREVYIKLKSIS
ncbi:MAG: 3'-5' exonuclease domain-containing protein 2 [Bacteriovoracaceae bacterium]|jgi:ribonuclease D|nr:3'-5' exonuclease domain-containing protein 2 [Bacteriovoracaceae bacterium]